MTFSTRKMRRQFESNPLVLRLLFFWVLGFEGVEFFCNGILGLREFLFY